MMHGPDPRDGSSPLGSSELLAEMAWLRGLAHAICRGDGALADDLTQDVAVAALEQRPMVANVQAWLTTVIRRRAVRLGRARGPQPIPPESLAAEPSGDDGPGDTVARLDAQQRLTATVRDLHEPYRSVITAHYLDGVPLVELARRQGVPPGTVRQQHRRALAMLREQLDREAGGWRTALVPLLGVPGLREGALAGAGGVGTGATAGGGVPLAAVGGFLMVKKLVAVAAIVLCALFSWHLLAEPEAPDPAQVEVADVPTPVPELITEQQGQPAGQSPAAVSRTETPQPASATAARLTLQVRGPDGQPVPHALVHCGPEDGISHHGSTDAAGKLVLAGQSGPGVAIVWAMDHAPFRASLPTLVGDHDIVLPGGGGFAGQVSVDGMPPGRSLLFRVVLRGPAATLDIPEPWFQRAPSVDVTGEGGDLEGGEVEVVQELSEVSLADGPIAYGVALADVLAFGSEWQGVPLESLRGAVFFSCGSDGRFDVHGVDRAHVEEIQLRALLSPLRILDREGEPQQWGLQVYHPPVAPEPIHIQMVNGMGVQGRLVFDDGSPVVGADLRYTALFPDGTMQPFMGPGTAGDGSFHLTVEPGDGGPYSGYGDPHGENAMEWFRLTVQHPGVSRSPRVWQQADLDPLRRGKTIELGDVVVARLNKPVFRIVDPEGAPLPGAKVLGVGSVSKGADSDGITTAPMPQQLPETLWVAARGWAVQEVSVPAGGGDPVELMLGVRTNQLQVTVPDALRKQIPTLTLHVLAEAPLYETRVNPAGRSGDGPSPLHETSGQSPWLRWWPARNGNPERLRRYAGEGMPMVLASVRPGVPIRIQLRDRLGQMLEEVQAVTPPWGEDVAVELGRDVGLSNLLLQVEGLEKPHRYGAVYWRRSGGSWQKSPLSRAGLCRLLTWASGATCEVAIGCEGYVSQFMQLQLTPGEQRLKCVMVPAEALELQLVDADGAPVDGDVEMALPDDGLFPYEGVRGRSRGPGHHVLRSAPDGPLDVLISVGGRILRRTIPRPAPGEIAQVEVPRPVQVTVQPPRWRIGQMVEVLAIPVGGEGRARAVPVGTSSGWGRNQMELIPGRYTFEVRHLDQAPLLLQQVVAVGPRDGVITLGEPGARLPEPAGR